MYSKNDYRYYLDNRLMHSDDFLAHYGVRGMKWKHRKGGNPEIDPKLSGRARKNAINDFSIRRSTDPHTGTKELRLDFNKHKGWSDGIGVRYNSGKKGSKKSLSVYDTTKTKWDKKNDDYVYENKKKGRLTKVRAEDGVEYKIDLSKKKKKSKKKLTNNPTPFINNKR